MGEGVSLMIMRQNRFCAHLQQFPKSLSGEGREEIQERKITELTSDCITIYFALDDNKRVKVH